MNYTTRDLQARINAIMGTATLKVDGMKGPNTRRATQEVMKLKGVTSVDEIFHESGLHRIHWHWTAGAYGPQAVKDAIPHYNDVYDEKGNQYDGGARPEHQANYNWRKKIGVSHTLNANTGAIGMSVTAMGLAEGWPKLKWGDYPLTWAGIDAMLEDTAAYCKEFDIPVSRWSTLSHAEVQPTLGIAQNGKWDYQVLPGMDKVINAVECGDILRKRLNEKFM